MTAFDPVRFTSANGAYMFILYAVTVSAVILSLIVSRDKTEQALKISFKKLVSILPAFFSMLMVVSIVLYLIPDSAISAFLGNENQYIGMGLATAIGSVAFMPGFIAYPLGGILVQKKVAYMVVSAFTTSLMMVGFVTLPLEKSYFGIKFALFRNLTALVIAIIVALATGFVFGELS